MISAVTCMSLRGVCNMPCVYALFWLVSIASYVSKYSLQGTKYEINHEYVVYLHSVTDCAFCKEEEVKSENISLVRPALWECRTT